MTLKKFLLSRIWLIALTALPWITASADEGKPDTSSGAAAHRVALLRKGVSSLRLVIAYEGEGDGPSRSLSLCVSPSNSGPGYLLDPVVRITEAQANRIIDRWEVGHRLEKAEPFAEGAFPVRSLAGRRYGITILTDTPEEKVRLHQDLGWGNPLKESLQSINAALEGEAAARMSALLQELDDRLEREAKAHVTEPVEANGLEFRAVGETTWQLPAGDAKQEFELALHITNRSSRSLRFNRFDTVRIVLTDESGIPIPPRGGRDKTLFLEPLILHPGETQVIARRGLLQQDQGHFDWTVTGQDGTLGWWRFENLQPGRYVVTFICESTAQANEHIANHHKRLRKTAPASIPAENPPFWVGKATTHELFIRITENRSTRP